MIVLIFALALIELLVLAALGCQLVQRWLSEPAPYEDTSRGSRRG